MRIQLPCVVLVIGSILLQGLSPALSGDEPPSDAKRVERLAFGTVTYSSRVDTTMKQLLSILRRSTGDVLTDCLLAVGTPGTSRKAWRQIRKG